MQMNTRIKQNIIVYSIFAHFIILNTDKVKFFAIQTIRNLKHGRSSKLGVDRYVFFIITDQVDR